MIKATKTYKNGIVMEFVAGYDGMQQFCGTAEPESLAWVVDHVHPDWTVLDIGAHVGLYTLILSCLTPNGYVHAFEPSDAAREMMAKNMSHNHGVCNFTNVRIVPMAVGTTAGRSVPATLWLTDGTVQYGKTDGIFNFTSIDEYCVNHPMVNRLDFIKIDADGWDYDILLGAIEAIQKYRPIILMEVNYALLWRNHNADDVHCLLESLKYQHKVIDPTPGNWLCWPEERAIGGSHGC
jgi:FkbM family methyltransferase